MKVQGLSNVDSFDLADKYFESHSVAHSSIDPNANINGKSHVNFQSEIFKAQAKLRGYYKLWTPLAKEHGKDEANNILINLLDGSLYFHDITKIDIPYCFAFDTSFVMFEGRPYGWLPGLPPKRSTSFMGQIVETTMDLSQQLAGAVAVPNLLVNLAYFTNKERQSLLNSFSGLSSSKDKILAISSFLATQGYTLKDIDFTFNISGAIEYSDEFLVALANKAYDKMVTNMLQQFVHVVHNTFRVGGDSERYSTDVVIIKDGELRYVPIGELYDSFPEGSIASEGYSTISFDMSTGRVSYKPIYATIRHENPSSFVNIKLATGQEIDVTDNHSMFAMDANGEIQLVAPKDSPTNMIIPRKFKGESQGIAYKLDKTGRKDSPQEVDLTEDFARLLGYYTADGHVVGSTLVLSLFNLESENFARECILSLIPDASFRYKDGSLLCNVGQDFCNLIVDVCGSGSTEKHIPTYMQEASDNVILAFLSGYFGA